MHIMYTQGYVCVGLFCGNKELYSGNIWLFWVDNVQSLYALYNMWAAAEIYGTLAEIYGSFCGNIRLHIASCIYVFAEIRRSIAEL